MIKEALRREQASVSQLEKLREKNKSLQDLLDQVAQDNQREERLVQEIEQLVAAKQVLQLALDELQQKIQQEKLDHAKETTSLKDLLGQLAKETQRDVSLTQELDQLKAEKQLLQLVVSELQQEKVKHDKESKSSRELLEQLAKDSQREVSLAKEIEQLRTEKQAAQQTHEEVQKEKAEQELKMQELLNKHDGMLAKLIHLSGKDKNHKQKIAELSDKLREANEELESLRTMKTKSEDSKCLADVMLSRATLQSRVDQMEAEEKISNKRLVVLQDRIELLQKETIRLQVSHL
ncbi:hypothetical protein PR048_030502 [Dryococelus australis]|uniref:Uncharacterized protein n=1 Tax=Dryococelus australis TaxID=614101 RepID=A0ABQ9GBR8_9NEOP|nr:hypothetical protein PR048_030502 [Dryococelus australis]